MSGVNKTFISGNLTRDPELSVVGDGTQVLNFRIAHNDYAGEGKDERVGYYDVAVFGARAEALAGILTKGMPVVVEAKLRYDEWEDKDTGVMRSKVSLVADELVLPAKPKTAE